MIKVRKATYRILNNLFYYSIPTAPSGATTYPMLGDLALAFAIAKNLGEHPRRHVPPIKPDYTVIRDFSFRVTVGKPVDWRYTQYYTRKTSFWDGGFNNDIELKTGSYLFKSFFYNQGIQAGAVFEGYIIDLADNLSESFTIRVGLGRETLVEVILKDISNIETFSDVWLNGYTLNEVLKKSNLRTELLNKAKEVEYVSGLYEIIKLDNLEQDKLLELK